MVLSPNSAIQAQWAARTHCLTSMAREYISTDPKKPGLLTSLTYQAVTAPGKGGEDIEEKALLLWAEKLIAQEEAHDHVSCEAWQTDLKEKNPVTTKKDWVPTERR